MIDSTRMDTPADSIQSLLETPLSRRQFNGGIATMAATSVLRPSLNAVDGVLAPITDPLIEVQEFASSAKEIFFEIAAIREDLGYTRRFSPALTYLRNNVVESYFYEKPPVQNISIELPPEYYYQNINKLSDITNASNILLGSSLEKILRRIRKGEDDTFFGFTMEEGYLNIPPKQETLEKMNRADLVDVVIHEVGGHGVDPDGLNVQESLTPLQILKMSSLKWRALSYADRIPNLFENHPQDTSGIKLDEFKIKLGDNFKTASFQSEMLGDGLVQGTPEAMQRVTDVYSRYIDVLKQHKDERNYQMVCLLMGSELSNGIKSGSIELLDQDLIKDYNDALEFRHKEIFAEMVKYSIMYPDLLEETEEGKNIKDCVQEFYRILRKEPKLQLEDLQAQLMQIQ